MSRKAINIIGLTFGMLTVLERAGTKRGYSQWRCVCSCGGPRLALGTCLRQGRVRSCGCLQSEDLTGQRFGTLTVIERDRTHKRAGRWVYRCDCGEVSSAQSTFLKNEQKTCKKCKYANITLHGHARTRDCTPTYRSWQAAIRRCHSKSDNDYARYGGRGIAVCERWRKSFADFLSDMGERPARTTLDRIDVNGSYEPGNCRWADSKTQARNKRGTKFEPHEPAQIRWLIAEKVPMSAVARFFGVAVTTIWRIANNVQWAEA